MIPSRDRPHIPTGYGITESRDGLLEWERVSSAITTADIYWLSTVGRGGPHLVPLHATAVDGEVFLSGDDASRWTRNLTDDQRIQVGLDQDGLQVMVRGAAALETPSRERFELVNGLLKGKYGWSFDEPLPMWIVSPNTVLAFDPDAFAASPTRFTFGGSS